MFLLYNVINMVRPRNRKRIDKDVEFTCFKPAWINRNKLEKIEINAEEFEAFRLSNLELLSNQQWGESMNTSSSTFNRLVKSAQTKIADWLVNWKGIRIYRIDWSHNCK